MTNLLKTKEIKDQKYLQFNLQWVVQKTRDVFHLFGMYGEEKTVSINKDKLAFKILEEVYKNSSITRESLISNLAEKKTTSSLALVNSKINALLKAKLLVARTNDKNALNTRELERYKWQLEYFASFETELCSRFDIQSRLKESKVVVIGLGGQGSIICQLLAAVGIGRVIGVDGDKIERSNLTRQIFFLDSDIGKLKARVMKRRIQSQNPNTKFYPVDKFLKSRKDIAKIITGADMVVLCADNPLVKLREWVNEAALAARVPYIAVSGNGVGPICVPFQTACFECEREYYRRRYKNYENLMKSLEKSIEIPRPSFAFRPVMSGTLIALQVVKFLSRVMPVEVLAGRFELDTSLHSKFEKILRNKNCHACGDKIKS
ncbi:MAG: UBA/THIF-type NAD/FAD binding protein [Parcubacteria group bacterium Gr01-1014_49]|nr:MAG: UBA/THIF-type NAD/FAD binding protein [Parcubacteria group bacterium Gr01-1014_49]